MLNEHDITTAYINTFKRKPESNETINHWINTCSNTHELYKILIHSDEYKNLEKKNKTITFHFGFHKTGTTSIQSWLEHNKKYLLDDVYIYNLHNGSSNPLKFACNHYELGVSSLSEIDNVCSVMRDQIDSFIQNDIIYTDETTLGLPLGFSTPNKKFTQSKAYPMSDIILDKILSNFTDYKVNIVIMAREYENWLKSIWNQMKKQSSFDGDFEEYKDKYMSKRTLNHILDDLKIICEKYPNVTYYPLSFEDEFKVQNIKSFQLFEICGISKSTLKKCTQSLQVINKSL